MLSPCFVDNWKKKILLYIIKQGAADESEVKTDSQGVYTCIGIPSE